MVTASAVRLGRDWSRWANDLPMSVIVPFCVVGEAARGADKKRLHRRRSTRAGKSTIAGIIAARNQFRIYDTDKAMADHGTRTSADGSPLLRRFVTMDMNERWVNRSPQAMSSTRPATHQRRWRTCSSGTTCPSPSPCPLTFGRGARYNPYVPPTIGGRVVPKINVY